MPEQHTELEIAGTLVDCRISYDYCAPVPGNYSGPPDQRYPSTDEHWEFNALHLHVDGHWQRCDLLLSVIDDDAIIDEIKAGWDEQ